MSDQPVAEEQDINERLVGSMDRLGDIMLKRVRRLTIGIAVSVLAAVFAFVAAGFGWAQSSNNGKAVHNAARGVHLQECVYATSIKYPNPTGADNVIRDASILAFNACLAYYHISLDDIPVPNPSPAVQKRIDLARAAAGR